MTGRRDGVVRGSVLAAFSALLTAVGHLAGGGTLPDLAPLVILLPLLAAVFVSLARRVDRVAGTVAVLAAGQLALHGGMVMLHPMGGSGGPPMLAAHAAVTLVTAVAVRHADAGAAAVAAVLRRVVPRRLPPLVADGHLPVRPVPPPDLRAHLARVLAVADAHRGPPAWC